MDIYAEFTKSTSNNKQNKHILLALKNDILAALDKKMSIKQIWNVLIQKEVIDMKYGCFHYHITRNILDKKPKAISKKTPTSTREPIVAHIPKKTFVHNPSTEDTIRRLIHGEDED